MVRAGCFAVFLGVPILFAILLARSPSGADLDRGMLEDPDDGGLNLLQKHAKVVHAGKMPMELAKSKERSSTVPAGFGISANGVGNLPVFLTGLLTDAIVIFVCFIIFKFALWRYPIMMKYRTTEKDFPLPDVPDGFFGWAVASWNVDLDKCWKASTLDHAMMLEFLNLSMNTFKWIALPMFIITGPLNCWFGGNAAGQDHESWFSLGNVKWKSWLYYVTAFACWWVVLNVTRMCHIGMRKFIPLRHEWLRTMPHLRASTLMMVGIPDEQQSDEACKTFWDTLLPGGKVEAVHITKDTSGRAGIQALHDELVEKKYRLSLAQSALEKDGKRPTIRASTFGSQVDAIDFWDGAIKELTPTVEAEQKKLLEAARTVGGMNLSTGFVTFKDRRDAEIALRMQLSDDCNVWVLDYAPAPVDVIWGDMSQDPTAEQGRHLIGYGLIIGVIIVYMPCVVWMCGIAESINLGPFQSIWASEAPSIGLTVMVDFLPTVLHLIFKSFFTLYDKTQSQYNLSVWYWWLNVLYVVLVTAIGTNFTSFAHTLINDPTKIFSLLADTMPSCTHYYMNYIGMQAFSQGMVLTRYFYLTKFLIFSSTYEEQEAKDMSEPEDQDYYGIGSRTARWSTMMCIGICFGTLSPPVSVLTWMYMSFLRLIYGYLFCYAECRKSDLGGIFFHRALHNMYCSMHIYMILMVGVLYQRGATIIPTVIVLLAWIYLFFSQKKFSNYNWQRLPYTEMGNKADEKTKHPPLQATYLQPELAD